jgi:predicted nucleotidyltransferase
MPSYAIYTSSHEFLIGGEHLNMALGFGDIIDLLKSIRWEELGVQLVVVHGSVLRSDKPRDIDLVAVVGGGEDDDNIALRVMDFIEKRLGLETDIYIIRDPGDVNCFLLWEALRHGVIVYQSPAGREKLVRAINICYDFMLSREKLGYTETLVKRVIRNAV